MGGNWAASSKSLPKKMSRRDGTGGSTRGGGSFSTLTGAAGISYARGAQRFSARGEGFHTDRYLDPPVLANYTNRGNAAGFSASYERDFSTSDRLRVSVMRNVVRFLVPTSWCSSVPASGRIFRTRRRADRSTSSTRFRLNCF